MMVLDHNIPEMFSHLEFTKARSSSAFLFSIYSQIF